jgi:hypothetical protein
MKKKATECTAEELLKDLTSYEDPDTSLVVSTTETGGVFIMLLDGIPNSVFTGDTFKIALLRLGVAMIERYPWTEEDSEIDWNEAKES